jgi:hypothetical protein
MLQPKDSFKLTLDCAANTNVSVALTPATGPTAQELRARSLVLQGQAAAPASIAAGGTQSITFDPDEDAGMVGRFIFADAGANDILQCLVATEVFLNGQRIWEGAISLDAMAYNATGVPWLAQGLSRANDTITMTVTNTHASLAATPVGCMVIVG